MWLCSTLFEHGLERGEEQGAAWKAEERDYPSSYDTSMMTGGVLLIAIGGLRRAARKADRQTAVRFLEALIAAVPYRLHTVLTDNGIQFADLPKNRDGWTARYRVHRFDQICRANGIEHRLTKPNHPWTNGQVERMNRTLKEATVNRYYYETHDQLRAHLADFLAAYNFGRRLKTLRGLTPYEHICQAWTKQPDRFILDPIHQMPGLNT
jgi:hypothetical protein